MSNQSPEKKQINLTAYEKNFFEYILALQESSKKIALKEAVEKLSSDFGGPEFQQRLAMLVLTISLSELLKKTKPQHSELEANIKLALQHLPNYAAISNNTNIHYPEVASESSRQLFLLVQYLETLLPNENLEALKTNILLTLAQEPDSRAYLIYIIENDFDFDRVKRVFDDYWSEQRPDNAESLVVAARYFARAAEQANISELVRIWKLARQLDEFSLPEFIKISSKSLLQTNIRSIIWQLQLRQKFEGRDKVLSELVEELQKFTD